MSRDSTKLEGIDQFNYEFPLQGLDTDSKQCLKGVAFYLDKEGEVVLARPIVVAVLLPDQHLLNRSINSGESASKILSRYRFDDLNEVQAYGLLSKWAIAVLARNSTVKATLDLSDTQVIKINGFFDGKLKVPEAKELNEVELTALVEDYAKKIIQFSPY